jgi:hypothetical protein
VDVSVVIPLYNKADYIARALTSVLAQSVPASEIIVVDDGSIDDGVGVVAGFGDKRVRLIRQGNKGAGAARNRGIAEARTDLIAFLDADDEWKPDFLCQIRRVWNNFPDCGAYATAFEVRYPTGDVGRPVLPDVPPPPWVGIIPRFFKSVRNAPPFCASSICVARVAFVELGGFPTNVARSEDFVMWAKLALHYPIGYSSSRQAVYHFEAGGRKCDMVASANAAAAVTCIDGLIATGVLEPEIYRDLVELRASKGTALAAQLIEAGLFEKASMLLARCAPRTLGLRRRKFGLLVLTRMPPWLIRQAIQLRRRGARHRQHRGLSI